MGKWVSATVAAIALVVAPQSFGQTNSAPANPVLKAEIDGVAGEEAEAKSIRFDEFALDIKTHGNIADAELTVTISNRSDDELEAVIEFQLPKDAAVTGYAIDLENPPEGMNDLLVDGVLLEERKARTAYENQVRQEIDPGLAQVSRAGVFTTNIYPVNEGETRRMRLRFSFPVTPEFEWPIKLDQPAGSWRISLQMEGLEEKPNVSLPGVSDPERNGRGKYAISQSGEESRIDGAISITNLKLPEVLISKHKSRDEFVHISGNLPNASGEPSRPELLRVYWDTSTSHKQGDIELERNMAEAISFAMFAQGIELITFDADQMSQAGFDGPPSLSEELKSIKYLGGSSLAALAKNPPEDQADLCLMFYDGVATVDRDIDFDPDCRLHILSSVPGANSATLSAFARKHGGEFHFLNEATDTSALAARIASGAPVLQSVRSERGRALPFITLPAANGKWAAAVKSQREQRLKLRFNANGKRYRREVLLDAEAQDYDGAGALWAKSELAERDDGLDRKAFLAFARKYSVEYPGLSFLVLEEPEDYVRNDITPPKTYPDELMQEYREERADADEELAEEKADRFAKLHEDWEDLKEWWSEEYDADDWAFAKRRNGKGSDDRIIAVGAESVADAAEEAADATGGAVPPPPPPPPPPAIAPPPPPANQEAPISVTVVGGETLTEEEVAESSPSRGFGGGGDCDEEGNCVVVVTAMRREPTIGVQIDAWQPDRPYLKALDEAEGGFDTAFLSQEAEHGSLPIFYLDVARWLRIKGHNKLSTRTLLSAMELPVANDETTLIVAQRLIQYGEYDRAIDLLDNLAARNEFLPQPKRHLALALIARAKAEASRDTKGDYERAIELLYNLAINPVRDGDEGIDLISLHEANAALSAAREAGAEVEMDERLVALLDADLRVVIDWTTETTDLDLWVIEPSGERAYYGNRETEIGGLMSDDMTDGFGPEVYLIRKAMPGDYHVRVKLYSSDRINPNGASILTARLIRNYGRPNETEQAIDVELMGGDRDDRGIGKLVVERNDGAEK